MMMTLSVKALRNLVIPKNARSLGFGLQLHQKEDHDEFTREANQKIKNEENQRIRDDEDEEIRDKILESALNHVTDIGWSREALKRGAMDLNYPDTLAGIVENPEIDLVHFHVRTSNNKLEEIMREEVETLRKENKRLKIGSFIQDKCRVRLNMNSPYITRWAEAMAMMSLPQNFPASLDLDLKMFDTIWHYAGDKATDYNWYTKRLSLGAIYKATELAMIQDKSEDFKDTWQFLERRFEDEINFSKLLSKPGDVQNVLKGMANTIQNIIGVPRN